MKLEPFLQSGDNVRRYLTKHASFAHTTYKTCFPTSTVIIHRTKKNENTNHLSTIMKSNHINRLNLDIPRGANDADILLKFIALKKVLNDPNSQMRVVYTADGESSNSYTVDTFYAADSHGITALMRRNAELIEVSNKHGFIAKKSYTELIESDIRDNNGNIIPKLLKAYKTKIGKATLSVTTGKRVIEAQHFGSSVNLSGAPPKIIANVIARLAIEHLKKQKKIGTKISLCHNNATSLLTRKGQGLVDFRLHNILHIMMWEDNVSKLNYKQQWDLWKRKYKPLCEKIVRSRDNIADTEYFPMNRHSRLYTLGELNSIGGKYCSKKSEARNIYRSLIPKSKKIHDVLLRVNKCGKGLAQQQQAISDSERNIELIKMRKNNKIIPYRKYKRCGKHEELMVLGTPRYQAAAKKYKLRKVKVKDL